MTFGTICDATGRAHRVGHDWACCTCGFTVPLGERYLFPHLLTTDEVRAAAARVKASVDHAYNELMESLT